MVRGPFEEKRLKDLGKQYQHILQEVDADREKLLGKTWSRALRNYEGKAPVMVFPWPGASNAVFNQTSAYSNDITARLYNAGSAHDPRFLVAANGPLGGLPPEEVSDILQDVSRYIEKKVVKYEDILEEAIPTFVIFGDTWLFPTWETDQYKVVEYNPDTGEQQDDVRTRSFPSVRVLHPKDFYVPCYVQTEDEASWCGYSFDLDEQKLRNLISRGLYTKKAGEKLLESLGTDNSKEAAKETYYREYQGQYASNGDEYDRLVKSLVGVNVERSANALDMVHVYASMDVDGDGIPEEVNFHVHRETGTIPYIDYSKVYTKRRPFFHVYFQKRVGSLYNKGVAELLFDTQKVLNTLVRDLLDNNKVQNTKMFLARKGANFDRSLRAYPGRVLFVENLESDFKPIDMGTGKPLSGTIEMISLAQQWGERSVGVTESNLGREGKSRTPLGTTLSLMQEGAKRVDRIIERMRGSLQDLHYHILSLYFDHGDPKELAKAAGVNAEKLLRIWGELTPAKLRDQIGLTVDISSSAWNRSFQRQELLALYAQIEAFDKRMVELASAIGQFGNDPIMRQLFLSMGESGANLMRRIVDTYDDIHDPEAILPDYAAALKEVTNAGIIPAAAQGPGGPAEAAQGVAQNAPAGFAPAVSPGRPPAELARPLGGAAGLQG